MNYYDNINSNNVFLTYTEITQVNTEDGKLDHLAYVAASENLPV